VLTGGDQAFLDGLSKAKEKYQTKEISWLDGTPDLSDPETRNKLILYAFVDDKEASTKALANLSHPWIAKDHGRMIFVKVIGRDNEVAKSMKVPSIPTFVFLAPALKESERVIDRRSGEISLRTLRGLQKKSFELIKKATEK
jgi:hypothetical protein